MKTAAKKIFIALVIVCLALLTVAVITTFKSNVLENDLLNAEKNYAFRGMVFESQPIISELKYLFTYDNNDNAKVYTKENDNYHLKNFTTDAIYYMYYNQCLTEIIINVSGSENTRTILDAVEKAYGKGKIVEDNTFATITEWSNPKLTFQYIFYKGKDTSISLRIFSNKMNEQFQNSLTFENDLINLEKNYAFHGFEFESIPSTSELNYISEDDNVKFYSKINDTYKFKNVEVENITYLFYKNRFTAVGITVQKKENIMIVLDAIKAQYGRGVQIKENNVSLTVDWFSPEFQIRGTLAKDSEYLYLFIASRRMAKLYGLGY